MSNTTDQPMTQTEATYHHALAFYKLAERVATRRNFDKWSKKKLAAAEADLILARFAVGNLAPDPVPVHFEYA